MSKIEVDNIDTVTGTSELTIGGTNATSVTVPTGVTTTLTDGVSGDFKMNSGYGSVATAYGVRAWVQFAGTGTISGSGNVSSVSDDGVGKYTINFSTAMPDTNYCYTSGVEDGAGFNDDRSVNHDDAQTKSTTAYGVYFSNAGVPNDPNFGHIAFFR